MSKRLRRVIGASVVVAAMAGALATSASPARPVGAAWAPAPAPDADAFAAAATSAFGIGCRSSGACTPSHGGAFISTTRNSCTAGLPVRDRRGQWYVLTAGHCVAGAGGATWRRFGLTLGRGIRWEYGGLGTEGRAGSGDIGLIRIAADVRAWNARSRVVVLGPKGARTQQIVNAKNARTGEKVCVTAGRSGSTRCGTVVLASTSQRYASPGVAARTVSNLAMVKGICVRPGDSGSPVFAGRSVIGIAVARSSSGCYLWYARIVTPLRHYGLSVAG